MQQNIIKTVATKAGIPESVAKIAVETVLAILKSKLPTPIGSQLDSFLGTGSGNTKPKSTKSTKSTKKSTKSTKNDSLDGLTSILGGIGSLLNKK
jgi:hypothetical protein